MGRRIADFDWGRTALGPIEAWPAGLKSTIKTLLASRYPMILLWKSDLIQIYNDAYINLIGEKHPHALGHSIRETQAESWEAIGPMIHEVMSSGVPNWVPAQLLPLQRAGYLEEAYFSLSYSAVDDDDGEIQGMLCVCSEITQQVVGERRLKLLREIASRTSEIRNVTSACEDMARIIGLKSADVPFTAIYLSEPGDTVLKLKGSSGLPQDSTAFPAVLDPKQPSPWPLMEALSGTTVTVTDVSEKVQIRGGIWNSVVHSALVMPIHSAGSTLAPQGVLIAGVSPNRALDDDYRSFYELLSNQFSSAMASATAYEEEKKRAEKLAEIDRAKTAFFSNISHEFRTPLTLMLGPLEDLISGRGATDQTGLQTTLREVYANSLRLLKLVNALLDFSRAEAGKLQARLEPTNLGPLTRELASHFESAAGRVGLKLILNIPDLQEPVFVDRDLWEKIVLNLLSNALKFTLEGEIEISLHEEKNQIELRVRDTGVGIPESELPKVFERFHRVQGTKSRTYEGTGIGLSLVQELTRLHQGSVSVESTVGKGSTFHVRVPKGSAHVPAQLPQPELEPTLLKARAYVMEAESWDGVGKTAAPIAKAAADWETVLIVDDNAGIRSYLSGLLSPSYQVTLAKNGREALTFLETVVPDLIISDAMMPELDGLGFLKEVRSRNRTMAVPFIMLSARAGDEAAVEGLEAGADDYLAKPFSAKELLARVRTQISMAKLRRDLESKKRSIQMRDEFLSVASHELKTPITSLKLQMQILGRKLAKGDPNVLTPASIQNVTDVSLRQIEQLIRLIEDMLDVSRLALGRLTLQMNHCDLSQLAEHVVGSLASQFQAKKVPFDTKIEKAISIPCDSHRLEQVMTNLLTNALKYGQGKPVFMEVCRELNEAKIMVKDQGLGIALENQFRIFDRFERAVSSNNISGLGLGLFITRQIVEAHGGRIRVESELGQGSTFTVSLPIKTP